MPFSNSQSLYLVSQIVIVALCVGLASPICFALTCISLFYCFFRARNLALTLPRTIHDTTPTTDSTTTTSTPLSAGRGEMFEMEERRQGAEVNLDEVVEEGEEATDRTPSFLRAYSPVTPRRSERLRRKKLCCT